MLPVIVLVIIFRRFLDSLLAIIIAKQLEILDTDYRNAIITIFPIRRIYLARSFGLVHVRYTSVDYFRIHASPQTLPFQAASYLEDTYFLALCAPRRTSQGKT